MRNSKVTRLKRLHIVLTKFQIKTAPANQIFIKSLFLVKCGSMITFIRSLKVIFPGLGEVESLSGMRIF